MRILYISPETPVTPAGGIGTYLEQIIPAMKRLGHQVHMVTWVSSEVETRPWDALDTSELSILTVDTDDVWRSYPHGPYAHALSAYLQPLLQALIDQWQPDVVETADFRGAGYYLYAALRSQGSTTRPLLVTFNHGFTEDVYWAASLRMSSAAAAEAVLERQQCRVSDLVLTPSEHAAINLRRVGVDTNAFVSREPFTFSRNVIPVGAEAAITHFGRVAVAKGIDKTVLLANRLDAAWPLERLLFVGALVPDPFKEGDIQAYINKRLTPRLAKATAFTGPLPRTAALSLLRPGDIAPHFSLSETFSYAFLECLDQGLLPLAEAGSPMAEFYPPELHETLLDPELRNLTAEVAKVVGNLGDATKMIATLQDYNAERLSPNRVAGSIAEAFGRQLDDLRLSMPPARRYSRDDVTILMAVHKPTEVFYETIDCIASQTCGPPKLILCSDGNAEEDEGRIGYAQLLLPETQVIRQAQSGLLASRNALLEACTSDLCLFLDADDWLDATFVRRGLDALNATGAQAAISLRRSFGETDETVLRHNLADFTHFNSNDLRMTALLERGVAAEIGFDAFRRNGEADDWIFWLTFVLRGHEAVLMPNPLFYYRLNAGSMSWPWNMGQGVGSAKMLMELTTAMSDDPKWAAQVARAHATARITDS